MFKMIFFDLGGTLIYTKNPHDLVFRECLKKFGIDIKIESITDAVESTLHLHPKEKLSFSDNEKNKMWWIAFYSQVLKNLGIDNEGKEIVQLLWKEHREGVNLALFSDTVEVLSSLKNDNYKLGIISNWDDTLYHMLDKFEIRDYFDLITVSSEIGCEKPDLRIFSHAVERSGFNPEDICYVGDDYYKDFIPSGEYGIYSIFLCHREAYPFAKCGSQHPKNLKDVEKIVRRGDYSRIVL